MSVLQTLWNKFFKKQKKNHVQAVPFEELYVTTQDALKILSENPSLAPDAELKNAMRDAMRSGMVTGLRNNLNTDNDWKDNFSKEEIKALVGNTDTLQEIIESPSEIEAFNQAAEKPLASKSALRNSPDTVEIREQIAENKQEMKISIPVRRNIRNTNLKKKAKKRKKK